MAEAMGQENRINRHRGIIQALKHKASTLIALDRFIPTTKECSNCHNKYDIRLDERTYECQYCGLIIDRDYNSSLNDMYYGIKKINEKYTCGAHTGIYACGDEYQYL